MTGQELQLIQGNVTVSTEQILPISGFSANISLGSPIIWQEIPGANNVWTDVDTSVTSSWSNVDTSSTNTWTEIAA